ncbi:hypothetical protein CAter282_3322 [Collimonas arenae]|uniref:DUF4429 domain-containing protein n=2 Tax=Collimonas arenae TaxID=279058 RepID=A0A127PTG8_9BURK|nr:hypothetical protein CAter10_3639 [Collimonas arenae]AMP11017.1 hypothetical protein CAter282_3322 [Collimonas arenae]
MARLTQARNGDKDILISALNGVRIQLPGLLSNGYIRFYPADGNPNETSLVRAASDANTVLFNSRQLGKFANLKTEIEKKIVTARTLVVPPPAVPATIDFDLLDQLNEQYKQGLISKAEWVSAKKRLLGL